MNKILSSTMKVVAVLGVFAILALVAVSSAQAAGYTFSTNLTVGSRGEAVRQLQIVLNSDVATQVAASGVGSAGNESTYFGGLTKAAVMKFQAKYGISPVAGFVGAITRAKLNGTTVVVTPGTPSTPTAAGTIVVSATAQPAPSLAPQSAARVPFTKVLLTAGATDVVVNSVVVERVGLAQDAVFAGIVLLDENGLQIGTAKTLNSNHQSIIGEPFTVRAGTTRTLTVAGNMAAALTNYSGQVVGLNVVAINTGSTVQGALPITGTQHTVNYTLGLGSASLVVSSYDPGSAVSKAIGETGYKFSGVRITAGSAEKVRLASIRWNQVGSVSATDLANLVTVVDGTSFPTTVSADGKYFSTIFPGGILIDKGFSKDVYLQGDIIGTGAAGRTADFDIYKTTDIYLTGETYGYGITPTGSGSLFSTTPFFNGYIVTITAGSATTIAKSNTVAAQNIAVNVPNQVLGGFETNFKGEPVSVQNMVFTVATSTGGTGNDLLTSVSIVDQNGAVVAGPVDATDPTTSDATQTLTFTDTVTFPVGKQVYTIKGKVGADASNGTTYIVSTTPSGWTSVTGQITGNSITISQGAFSMNTMTVKAAALAVTVSTNPVAQKIVAGAQNFLFTNYQFDATQSGEDVRFASMGLTLTKGSGAYTDLTNCIISDGSTALTTGGNVINPTVAHAGVETFTFDQALTVPKGTVKTLSLSCNTSSGASSTYKWGATAAQIAAISATGVTSSNSVIPTGAENLGNLMTVNAGSLAVTTDSSSPAYTIVAAGTTGNILGVANFKASNEAVNLQKVGLVLTNSASSTSADLAQVTLWYNGSQVGTATFTGGSTHATSTDLNISLPKDQNVTLTIKGDLANIGTSESGHAGALIAVDVEAGNNTYGTGAQSGATVYSSGTTSVAGVRMFKSYPIVAKQTSGMSSTLIAQAGIDLYRFSITASSKGPIALNKLVVNVATSSYSTTNGTTLVTALKVYAYTDSSFSNGVAGFTDGQVVATVDNLIQGNNVAALSSPLTISAGATTYFKVVGTVTQAAGTTGSAGTVTTKIVGDSAYYASPNLMDLYVTGIGNFVWSPLSTSTASLVNGDWTNGYAVTGLSSSGTDAFTLTK